MERMVSGSKISADALTDDKIAIIGAGPVGLSAARALKLKNIDYDQFEAESSAGGNWRHGVYSTAHIISSRKTTEFPDHPMPETFPDFPSAGQMLEYLNEYSKHYQLLENIQFNTHIESIRPVKNDRWEVRITGGDTRLYKGVIICNGHHWDRRWPNYQGKFGGEYIHSKDYKHPDQLKGKRVLVIGGGNSSCDIATEAARVARTAHLSLRRGYWFLPKTFYGKPTAELLDTWLPVWMQRIYITSLLKIVVGDYRNYGLEKPDHALFEHHPTINTELLHYLKHGKLTAHPDVKSFENLTVEFVDGTREDFDMVVCGTGYNVSIPCLPPDIVSIEGPVVKAVWGLIAPHHKNLYVYGWGQARYGFGPLLTPASELLADLIIMQNKLKHPLGEVLTKLKQKQPKTHLVDPMDALRQIKGAKMLLPFLPLADKYLM